MDGNEIYKAPESDLAIDNSSASEFFVVKPTKLLIMGVLTFGLYYVFVSYRNWTYLKTKHNLSIWPIPRALFAFLFIVAFVRYLIAARDAKGIPASSNLVLLATLYLIYSLLTFSIFSVLGGIGVELPPMVSLGSSILGILIQVTVYQILQGVINAVMDDVEGKSNARFGAGAVVMILLGLFVWWVNVFLLFFTPPVQ